MDIVSLDNTYVANTYARFPVHIVSGKGAHFTDVNGRDYIDLTSGIGVNSFGVADDTLTAAVTKQMGLFQHTSNLYYTAPCATLAEKLCKATGMKKVFFSNSGAEANETAIKAARKYAADKRGIQNPVIITLENSFHGRTHTTLAATGQAAFHEHFLPLTDGFVHIIPDINVLRAAIAKYPTAAILFETVRGEGGVLPLDKAFVTDMAALAAAHDILLMVDEVQTGNGRTGTLYSYMQYGFTPDVVSTAKGLGGGLPIGATLLGDKVADVFTVGLNGSTFGGNPVACAAANTVIDRLDEAFLKEVRQKSAYVFETLQNAKGVENVTGLGLMIGIKTVKPAKEIVCACIDRGVLALTAKDKVRLLPPLNIPMGDLQAAIEILKDVIAEGL